MNTPKNFSLHPQLPKAMTYIKINKPKSERPDYKLVTRLLLLAAITSVVVGLNVYLYKAHQLAQLDLINRLFTFATTS